MKEIARSKPQTGLKNINSQSPVHMALKFLTLIKLIIVMALVFPAIGQALDKEFGAEIFPRLFSLEKTCEKEDSGKVLDLFPKPLIDTKHSEIPQTGVQVAKRTPDMMGPSYFEKIQKLVSPVQLVINVAARKLKVYKDDKLVKSYSVAVGSPRYRTPLGNRHMSQIIWNPWWIPPQTSKWAQKYKKTAPGARNPLGPVKMNLGNAILIHGTTKPHTIGTAASHGCMRMKSSEAKELARYIQEQVTGITNKAVYAKYDRNKRRSYYVKLPVNVPVRIVYKIAEVEEGNLYVYKDIYHLVKNKMATVHSTLQLNGYNTNALNMNHVKQKMRAARNQRDLTFSLTTLSNQKLVNNMSIH